MSAQEPTVTFWTDAPSDAPHEIKGHTCYFHPERLEWTVTPSYIRVTAHGPATRVQYRQGSFTWFAESRRWGDERPSWLLLPIDAITTARLAVESISKEAQG